MLTHEASHYLKLQIRGFSSPFDSLSFFVTIWIIRASHPPRLRIRIFISPGPFHRHSGHPLGALRLYLRRMDHKPLGKRARGTRPKRNQVHQQGSTGSAGPDREVKRKNICFGLIMGVSAALPTCLHMCLFSFPSSES